MKDKIESIEITRKNISLLNEGAEYMRVEEARLRTLINDVYQTVYSLLLEKDGYVKEVALEVSTKLKTTCDIFQNHWKEKE